MASHAKPSVRKMDPRPIYFGFLVFDDQHNQIGLINLQVIVLYFNRVQDVTWTKASDDPMINTISKTLEAQEKT